MARPTRLEFSAGTSRKFWQVVTRGPVVTVTYGRIGTEGQTQVRTLATAAAAQQEASKLIAGKLEKGYATAGPGAGSVANPAAKRASESAAEPAAKSTGKSPAKSSARTGSQPALIVKERHGDLGAVWIDDRDLWFARVFAGGEGEALLERGGTLADAVAAEDGGAVERWRFDSAAEASRAVKWIAGHAATAKLSNDCSADIARWTKRVKEERPCIPRLEVGSGPVTLTRDATHPWIHARPPATSFLSKRTMVPVYSLVGPLDARFGARTGFYVSVCPQAMLEPYIDHVWEVVVQDPSRPSAVDAYFESSRGFWTIHLSMQIETISDGVRWAVVEHSGDRSSVGWYRTEHFKTRAEAEKMFRERVSGLGGGYKRVDRLGPWHAKILAEITRHHRVPRQKPATMKLRQAHAAMAQRVDGSYVTPSNNMLTREVVWLGGTPRFCQEDWNFVPANPNGKGKLLAIASVGRGDGPQWSDILNDGDAGTINFYAAPGEPFGTVSFSCG